MWVRVSAGESESVRECECVSTLFKELDDGWPESETCNCPALSKRCEEREREGGCEGVTV